MQPLPFWISGSRSIWLLDRGPTAGVYLRGADGSFRKLSGEYRVSEIYGAGKDGTVYLAAAYPTRRDQSLLALALQGGLRNLTPEPGWHQSVPSPTFNRFVDRYSRLNDPPRMDLGEIPSGHVTSLVAENAALKAALLPARMLQVPSAYGPLDAFEIDPPGFDPAKKWPVVMYVYGGPDAPTTADRFGGPLRSALSARGLHRLLN